MRGPSIILKNGGLMARNIKTNTETKTGAAKTYLVDGKIQTRSTTVKDTEQGKNPGYHVIKVNETKYVRSDPDASKNNNVDPAK